MNEGCGILGHHECLYGVWMVGCVGKGMEWSKASDKRMEWSRVLDTLSLFPYWRMTKHGIFMKRCSVIFDWRQETLNPGAVGIGSSL